MDNFFKDKTVALFYGGRSPEHEVSLQSAKTVYPILKDLFKEVYPVGVSKKGCYSIQNLDSSLNVNPEYKIENTIKEDHKLIFIPSNGIYLNNKKIDIDLAFILIHGNEGEDGKIQGLLHIMDIKYAGANTASSAVGIYKQFTHLILKASGIRTVDTIVITKDENIKPLAFYQKKLSSSLFVKSETTGSSVGAIPLKDPSEEMFKEALKEAFKYSERVLIQPLMENMQEMEVAVLELSNKELVAGGPGVIVDPNNNGFLSYEKKYSHTSKAYIDPTLVTDKNLIKEIQNKAKKIFKILNLSGYSRIDFFYKDNEIYLNEVNTIPGLTSRSHYPVLINSASISLLEAIYEICRRAYE